MSKLVLKDDHDSKGRRHQMHGEGGNPVIFYCREYLTFCDDGFGNCEWLTPNHPAMIFLKDDWLFGWGDNH